MNDLERQLVFLYTIIGIILSVIIVLFPYGKKKPSLNIVRKALLPTDSPFKKFLIIVGIVSLGVLFIGAFCFCYLVIFVLSHGIADMLIDDFATEQIITNAFNIYLLYLFFTNVKETKDN